MKNTFVLLLLVLLIAPGCKKEDPINPRHTGELYLDHSTDIAVALQKIQNPGNYLWSPGWWESANIMEAMIDYGKNSGADVSGMCKQIYNANQYFAGGDFKNRTYDDCGWWALAWIKAYDQYGDGRYLQTAEDIFAYMAAGGWDNTTCNGGMAWQNIDRYKNAITNELFILLAARLASRQGTLWQKAYYLDWALKGWNWLEQSGMRNADYLFNDGLDKNCNNNGATTWTYNQGVILAALKEIYTLTNNPQYLQSARQTAFSSMAKLSDADSILTEPCGRNWGEDAEQFKGPYIKFLSELNTVLKDSVIKQYIVHNAATAWGNAQNSDHLFDGIWQGPFENWQGSATGVALDLMNAATVQLRQ